MKKTELVWMLLAVVAAAGCTRDDHAYDSLFPGGDYAELKPRIAEIPCGAEQTIKDMAPSNVIVAVNGYTLTKEEFEFSVALEASHLMSQKGADQNVVSAQMKERMQFFVPEFVRVRLLLDEAKRLNLLTTNDVAKSVKEIVIASAKAKKRTPEQFLRGFNCDSKYVFYDLAVKQWVNALIAKKIPPQVEVDDAFVKAVQDQVTADNEAAKATNELYKVMLAGWKKEAESGIKTFTQLAKEHSQDFNPDSKDGSYWGEWERGQMDSMKVQAAAFSVKLGEITDPVEDENGIHIVKVLKIEPAVKNDKGRVIQHEIRTLAHIYIEKEPLLLRQTDKMMFRDVKRQMQLQAINAYVEVLKTNGVHKVVYPHGENLFRQEQ